MRAKLPEQQAEHHRQRHLHRLDRWLEALEPVRLELAHQVLAHHLALGWLGLVLGLRLVAL